MRRWSRVDPGPLCGGAFPVELAPTSITWSGPAANKRYNTSQTVSWTIAGWEPAGSTPGSGIAGQTLGWDSIPSEPSGEPNGGSGNSFYGGPQFPNGATGCLAFEPNGCSGGVSQGCHTAWARGWNNQGFNTWSQSGYPENYTASCDKMTQLYAPIPMLPLQGMPFNGGPSASVSKLLQFPK